MATTDQIFIQVGDEVIELLGEEKESFLQRIATDLAEIEAEEAAKAEAEAEKAALLERLGITEDEAKLLLS